MKINIGKNDICYTCRQGKQTECSAGVDDIFLDDTRNISDCRCYVAKEKKAKSKRFVKPTVEEIAEYVKEKGYIHTDPQAFYDYYESVDWYRGSTKITKWKMAVAGWEKRQKGWADDSTDTEICFENIDTLKKIYPNIDWDWYEQDDFKITHANSKHGKGVVFLSRVQEDILLDEMDDVSVYDYYIEMLAEFIIKKNAKPQSHFKTIMKWYKSNFKI